MPTSVYSCTSPFSVFSINFGLKAVCVFCEWHLYLESADVGFAMHMVESTPSYQQHVLLWVNPSFTWLSVFLYFIQMSQGLTLSEDSIYANNQYTSSYPHSHDSMCERHGIWLQASKIHTTQMAHMCYWRHWLNYKRLLTDLKCWSRKITNPSTALSLNFLIIQ